MSTRPKLLITGGSGFLASALIASASDWDVFATCHQSCVEQRSLCKVIDVDITNRSRMEEVICSVSPSAIIHTAAIADLAFCSSDRHLASQVNIVGTENVALAAQKCGAKMVFTSTDLVYSGSESNYSEDDIAEPSCYYGQTKLEAEKLTASLCSNYSIARIALIYGRSLSRKKCFAELMLNRMAEGGEAMGLFSNEYRSPVYLEDLCNVLLQMASRDDAQGIYNIGGPQRMSRYEFGLLLAETFNLDKNSIKPVNMEQAMFNYHRPEDCSMSIEKALHTFGDIFQTPRQGIEKMKQI
ncbi:MAG: SDR family oxidoreductase [Sedimentisphaeraceae bacterium JB056]